MTDPWEQRLDEDFVFILNFFGSYMNNFKTTSKLVEHDIFQAWLDKLCIEPQQGRAKKRLRNSYLCKLFTCLQATRLTPPFTLKPKAGPLTPLPNIPVNATAEPPWLRKFLAEQENKAIFNETDEQINCKTYLATKMMKNEKGACAFLAVSAPGKDEGAADNNNDQWHNSPIRPPQWISMATDDELIQGKQPNVENMPKKGQTLKDLYASLSLEERKQIYKDIQNELDDVSLPFTNDRMEQMVQKYKDGLLHEQRMEMLSMGPHRSRNWLLKEVQKNLKC